METQKIHSESEITGISVSRILVRYGLACSISEAKRLIQGNGVTLNGKSLEFDTIILDKSDFIDGKLTFGVGKHRKFNFEVTPKDPPNSAS
jgi:tyrosyl-tRNA synthetase